MKKTAALLMALGLALPAITLADDENRDGRPPRRDGPPPREGRESGEQGRRGEFGPRRDGDRGPRAEGPRAGRPLPPPPLFAALDANRDGTIDESEIRQASESLRKLDKNNDGKLTMEELRPGRPDGERGEGGHREGVARPRGGDDRPEGDRPRRERRGPEGR
jgi:hypothetical protein